MPIPARASSDAEHLGDSDGEHFAVITACGDSSVISRLDGWLTSWVMSWETIASKTPNGSINVWPIKLSQLRLLAGGSSTAHASPVPSTLSPPSNARIATHASYPRKSFCHHTEHQGTALSVDPNSGSVWIGASDGSIVQYQLYNKRMTLDASAEDGRSADAAIAPAPSTAPSNHSIDIELLRHSFNLPHANRDWLGQLFYNAHQRELYAVSNDMIATVCLRCRFTGFSPAHCAILITCRIFPYFFSNFESRQRFTVGSGLPVYRGSSDYLGGNLTSVQFCQPTQVKIVMHD